MTELHRIARRMHDGSQMDEQRCLAPDWSAIEEDYRSAGLSLRQLAAKHGCHHSSIVNRAQRHGWTRSPIVSSAGVES
jgi:hypothetical protein